MIAAAVAAALALAAAEPVRDRDYPVAEAPRVYDLPTAEALAAEGYTGVRAFFTDAWGRHQPAVAVLRKGDAAPRVLAWTKGQPGGIRAMSGEISRWDWRVIQLLMEEVAAAPEEAPKPSLGWPEPPSTGEDADEEGERSLFVCTDSSDAMVEVIAEGKVIRRERSSCGDDIAYDGASSLLNLAADSIEPCDAIQLQRPNRPISRLLNCSILTGEDRWDAADLLNAIDRAPFNDAGGQGGIAKVLDPAARLTLADGSVRQGPDIADWFAAETARPEEPGLQADSISVDGDVGRVVGGLFYLARDDAYFWAPSEQTWRREGDGPWRLVDWKVGSWRREVFTD
jgi:hypothetical protein